jgi:hypothetical protein
VPIVNGYCSVGELREQLDDEYQKISDTLIERAINAVSRAIDKYCGFPRRKFWKDVTPTTHEYVVGTIDALYIDDVASRSGLILQTDISGDGSFGSTWSLSDFVLKPLNVEANGPAYAFTLIEAVGNRLFPTAQNGRPTVRVTAFHGWSEVPDEVAQACLIRSTSILKRKDAPFGVAGFGEFGTSVRIRAEDPDVADLLGPFRRYGAGTV